MRQFTCILIIIVFLGVGASALVKRSVDPVEAPLVRSMLPPNLAKDYLRDLIRQAQLELDQLSVAERSAVPDSPQVQNRGRFGSRLFGKRQLSPNDPQVKRAFNTVKSSILKAFTDARKGTNSGSFEVTHLVSATKSGLDCSIKFNVREVLGNSPLWQCKAKISNYEQVFYFNFYTVRLNRLDCHKQGGGPKFTGQIWSGTFKIVSASQN